MRGQNQSETFDLKYRLTGAAVLIGFAVIVLPLLLGGPGDGGEARNNDGMRSGTDTKVFRSNITPIGGETPSVEQQARVGESGEDAGREPDETPPPDGVAGDSTDSRTRAIAPQTTGEDTRDPEDAAAGDDAPQEQEKVERGWIVQVGTFKNPENVEKISQALENNGFGSSTTEVETSEGVATRVWVGPYATRVEAARAKTRVKQRTGSEGLIVAYP